MSKKARRAHKEVDQSKEQIKQRRLQSLRTLYFNRFLIIRYTFAACFFGNFFLCYLDWGHWIGYIALALLLAAVYPFWELGTMYGKSKVKYRFSQFYCQIQWVFNLVLLVMIWTLPMSEVFPFFSDTGLGRTAATVLVGIGFILLTLSNIRFRKIETNTDKVYRQIQFYEQKFNLSI